MLAVVGLAGWRGAWWWCHPSCSSVWAEAVVAAAAGVEAAGNGLGDGWMCWSVFGHLREAEEEEECDADDDCEGYPAAPGVPV